MDRERRIEWVLSLSDDDLRLLAQALDSHAYWELADSHERNNGFVMTEWIEDDEKRAEVERVEELGYGIKQLLRPRSAAAT
jgi:hypothetical protein